MPTVPNLTSRRRLATGVAASALAAALTVAPHPVQAQAGTAAPGTVSTEAIMADVATLAADAMAGRDAGSEGGRAAREYIVQRLEGLGFAVEADTFPVPRVDRRLDAVNVRVRVEGSGHPDRHVVVTAHYDHVGVRNGEIYNGADDNASGVAALLALAEALTDEAPQHTMTLVFLDAEEGGLRGARQFVADAPVPLDAVLMNVNFDMVSRSERDLWVSGTYPWPELRPIFDRFEAVAPVELRAGHDTPQDQGADNWVMASDHAAFHERGIPFLYFGVADHPDYHRPTDDAERIDPIWFTAAVETLLGAVRTVDQSLDGRRPDDAG